MQPYQNCGLNNGIARVPKPSVLIINHRKHHINEILLTANPPSIHVIIDPTLTNNAQLPRNPLHRLHLPPQIHPSQRRKRDQIGHHKLPRQVHKLLNHLAHGPGPHRLLARHVSLPGDLPQNDIQSQFLDPITHIHRRSRRRGLDLAVQLADAGGDFGFPDGSELLESAGREDLQEDDLPHLAPVRALGEGEGGVVEAEVLRQCGRRSAGEDFVVGGEALLDGVGAADDDGGADAEADGENGAVFVGERGQSSVEWDCAGE